jgi:hypothetical protein
VPSGRNVGSDGRLLDRPIAAGFLHHLDGPHGAGWAAGGDMEQPEPGVLVWSLPHGRSYVTRPVSYPV